MYYTHFGLTQPPFRITPNTEFFFGGGNRGPILEALLYAISQGEGIIKVTGEVGSGKTMLCNMMQARLPPNIESVYLANPSVSPEEILHAIARELHLKPARNASRLEVMQMLNEHLLERHAAGKQVVMFVEESQSMPITTLEEIRLLSNLETAHSKLLQIVLFGQPELEENLGQTQIRQLRERITHSFRLSPLKPDEIRDYLNFRLRAAGYRGPDLFSPPVINAIAKSSGGLTRRVNLIADKALLATYAQNTHTITIDHVNDAVRDSEFSHYGPAPARYRKIGLAVLVFMVGAGIGILLYTAYTAYFFDSTPRERVPAATQPPPAAANSAPGASALGASATLESGDGKATAGAAAPAVDSTPVKPPAALPATAKKNSTDTGKPVLKLDNSIAGTNSRNSATAPDEVENRIAATNEWLAQIGKNPYSVQLLGADDPVQLKNHLNIIRKYIEINDIFVYRTVAKQKPSLTVLFGSFDSRRDAMQALEKLPTSLKAYKPVLRTLQGIRGEIARHQRS
jgi:type II secretory pathway predicted ATPase ExeA